jgi:hypothetical protein
VIIKGHWVKRTPETPVTPVDSSRKGEPAPFSLATAIRPSRTACAEFTTDAALVDAMQRQHGRRPISHPQPAATVAEEYFTMHHLIAIAAAVWLSADLALWLIILLGVLRP